MGRGRVGAALFVVLRALRAERNPVGCPQEGVERSVAHAQTKWGAAADPTSTQHSRQARRFHKRCQIHRRALFCCAARWCQLDGSGLMVLATRSAAMTRSGMFRFWDTVRSTSNPVSAGQRCMPMMMPMAWSITDREDSAVRR